MKPLLALVLVLALAGPPTRARAQAAPVAAGVLAGRVIDAASGGPVASALVTLEAAGPGLVVEPGSARAVMARSMVTAESGAYRFDEVVPGRYRLRVERIGFRPVTVEVEVLRPTDASVSVGLELQPVELHPVSVEARAASLFQRAAAAPPELEAARIASERERQALFLTPDARMLTYADVMDGVTLGEGDVFRAIQRFPGVGTRDDYTAELWTRGAPWTHTRVTFDGVPLFNPVHAVGVLSAFTPEVLGAVFFHPGVSPASAAGAAAGVVDLRTRPGGGTGELRGVVDLSMASAKVALDQVIDGRGAWVLAGRRSHLGVLSGGLGRVGLDTVDLPYVFHDLAGRFDLRLGREAMLEASGLWEEDVLRGDVEGVLERTDARWGNAGGRVTLRSAVKGLALSHTVAASRFTAETEERVVRVRAPTPPWTEPASRNRIVHARLSGELAPPVREGAPGWALGWDVVRERVRYEGPPPRYYAARPDTVGHLRYARELTVAAAWGEARVAVGERLELSPGVRLEAGFTPDGGGGLRTAPRLSARWSPSPDQTVSLAFGRSWQYSQAIALAGPSIHPAFHAAHFWLWADERTPPIRSNVVSVGAERWLGGAWLASGSLYLRRATGVAVPDPTPGFLQHRPAVVNGTNVARGVDLGLRRIGTRWSTALGWSWGESDIEAGGLRYPASADRREVVDAMAAVRLPAGFRVAAAYTAMSGAPFTRAISRSPGDCDLFGFGCGTDSPYLEAPSAERTPPYRSLDVSLQWARPVGRAELAAYVQVRNVLGRDNASTYSGTVIVAGRDDRRVYDDRFEAGLPRLPLVGLRVTF